LAGSGYLGGILWGGKNTIDRGDTRDCIFYPSPTLALTHQTPYTPHIKAATLKTNQLQPSYLVAAEFEGFLVEMRMFKKHYFASAIAKKNDKDARTFTATGWDWFWVSPIETLKNIQIEIEDFCNEDMGKQAWDSIHVSSFNRI